jgi:hypothetical protein
MSQPHTSHTTIQPHRPLLFTLKQTRRHTRHYCLISSLPGTGVHRTERGVAAHGPLREVVSISLRALEGLVVRVLDGVSPGATTLTARKHPVEDGLHMVHG